MRNAAPGRRESYLLYVCYEFPVLTQTFTLGEVRGLRDEGLDLQVVSCRPARPDPALVDVGDVPVRNLPRALSWGSITALFRWAVRRPIRLLLLVLSVSGGRYRDQHAKCWLRGFGQLLWGVRLADDLCREGRQPHFHAQFVDAASTVAFVAARLLDTTFSFTNHTAYNPYLLKVKLKQTAAAVSISEFDRELLLKLGRGAGGDRIHVIHQGIDTEKWQARRSSSEGSARILSVAALREKKGHDVLIRAVGILASRGCGHRLTIVGDGPERPRLERLVEGLGLSDRVDLVGAETPMQIKGRLAEADVFALACVRAANGDIDGVPISLMEAMAAGVPVVSTVISGIPELIEHEEEGLLAPPGDPAVLADLLQRCSEDPVSAARRVLRAREKVLAKHDRRRSAAELAALIREVSR